MRKDPFYVRGYLPDDLPRITSYDSALRCYENITPFQRGNNIGVKPLGKNRRYSRFQIRKGNVYDSNAIIIKHYNTDIITYYTDNTLHFNTGHQDSISTCQAMQELLGVEKFVRRNGKIYYHDGNGHFFRTADGLKIGSDNTVINPPTEQIYVLNRKRFTEVKKPYAPFTDYVKQIIAVTRGGSEVAGNLIDIGRGIQKFPSKRDFIMTSDWMLRTDWYGLRWYGAAQAHVRKKFFDQLHAVLEIENEAERIAAMYPLAQYVSFCSSTSWSKQANAVTMRDETLDIYRWETDVAHFTKFFNELMKIENPVMCFDLVDAPRGKITHNANAKYVHYSTTR